MDTDIDKLIPQKKPFLFIDEIIELRPMEYGLASTKIRGDEEFFKGHFPDNPVFPAVLMIEAAGQLANAVLRADSRYADAYLFHTKMSKVKFMGAFLPGDIMQSEVTVEQQMDSLFFTHVQIKRDETAMFSADMVFLIKEGEK